MQLQLQVQYLFLIAIPIACITWTVTHEEIFKEPRDYCEHRSIKDRTLLTRKFFYLFTCEYCFSHYVVILFLIITDFHLLIGDWRGYLIGGFALVWIANIYMYLYGIIRQDIKKEKTEVKLLEKETKMNTKQK